MMPTLPIDPQDAEPFTSAIHDLQEALFEASLSWEEEAARATYACADAALDVARQLLTGTLAPSEELWTALTAALLDERPLPWTL